MKEPTTEPSKERPKAGTASPTSWSAKFSKTDLELEVELDDQEELPGLGEEELPHMLLPDSLSQLEEFGRQKLPRKVHRGYSRPRLFSDLWVRIGDSTTPPSNVRIINGYVTVEPPLTHQEQQRRTELYLSAQHPSMATSTQPSSSSAQHGLTDSTLTLSLSVWLLSHLLFTS